MRREESWSASSVTNHLEVPKALLHLILTPPHPQNENCDHKPHWAPESRAWGILHACLSDEGFRSLDHLIVVTNSCVP